VPGVANRKFTGFGQAVHQRTPDARDRLGTGPYQGPPKTYSDQAKQECPRQDSNLRRSPSVLLSCGTSTAPVMDKAVRELGQRHAHLAVNAAFMWCQLMLDTLADPNAPWRKQAAAVKN
jgi:hypothetical protein